jgi:hypothetical protein
MGVKAKRRKKTGAKQGLGLFLFLEMRQASKMMK